MNDELKGRLKLGLLVLSTLFFALLSRACREKQNEVPKDRIVIGGQDRVTENNPGQVDKETQEPIRGILKRLQPQGPYVPPEGSTTIEPKDPSKNLDDLIKIHRKIAGFTFEPGISTALFAEPNVGLDFKWTYLGRFGLISGVLVGRGFDFRFSPMCGISYRLDRIPHIKNTEAWLGWVPLARIPYQLGVRINL